MEPTLDRTPLANLRHDLRTPINHILGYSELILEDAQDSDPALVDDLNRIRNAANTLLEMVATRLSDEAFAESTPGRAGSMNPPTSPDSAPPAPAAPDLQPATPDDLDPLASVTGRILVVDDDPGNRDTLVRRIQRQGHTAVAAADGIEALASLRAGPFDLVLLDILMPGKDGYSVLTDIKSDPALRHIPVIMISALDEIESVVRCIETGAEDYLPKPFNPTLLRARIGASLEKKALRDQEQEYLHTIERTQKRLSDELHEAANYVRSIIPAPISEPFAIDWRYVPSTELGGDAFGYHWIDDEHFAIYLLDVCGHGVGASLLSVTAINVLRSGSLVKTDLRDPGQVLSALNDAFQMENQNDMYFTIWYGVYHAPTRTLRHSSGGHPPALLLSGDGGASAPPTSKQLRCPGALVGVMPGIRYTSESCTIPEGSRLLVFCDGVYEIKRPDNSMIDFEDFESFMIRHGAAPDGLDALVDWVRDLRAGGPLEDDFSILRIHF